jgi:hypothetical protein
MKASKVGNLPTFANNRSEEVSVSRGYSNWKDASGDGKVLFLAMNGHISTNSALIFLGKIRKTLLS